MTIPRNTLSRRSCVLEMLRGRFAANQLRLTMTAAAFVLLRELRADAHGTQWARATVTTLRCRILKIAARIVETKRQIAMHMPKSYPLVDLFQRLALSP